MVFMLQPCLIIIIILIVFGIVYVFRKMPTRKENKFNKKKPLIISILILSIFSIIIFWYFGTHSYDINIERKYSTPEEEMAMHKAEELDLATILNKTRYNWGIEHAETNDPSTDPKDYVWPSLIDKEALDFYENKINKLKKNIEPVIADFNYRVEVKESFRISISYDNNSRQVILNAKEYSLEVFNSHDDKWDFHSAIYLDDELTTISNSTQSVHLNLSNGYIITQDFNYEEIYGPLAGFGGGAKQTIVLDEQYSPVLILSKTKSSWIS